MTSLNFQKVKGEKQIRAIVELLIEGEPVHNSGGRYVLIGGKRFLRKHLDDALGIYEIMRRNQRTQKIEQQEEKRPMARIRRMVEGIFLGRK